MTKAVAKQLAADAIDAGMSVQIYTSDGAAFLVTVSASAITGAQVQTILTRYAGVVASTNAVQFS